MEPKILLITTSFLRFKEDKLSSFIFNLARKLTDKYDVFVIAPHSKGAKKAEIIEDVNVFRFVYAPSFLELFGSGVSIFSILKNKPLSLLLIPTFILSGAFSIFKLHLKNRFDIIHVHWLIPFGPVVGIMRKIFKFRFIISSHGSDVFPFANNSKLPSLFVRWLHKVFTLPNVDCILPVSSYLKDKICFMFPDIGRYRIRIISMGIDYKTFSDNQLRKRLHTPLKIIYIGRLAEIKGVKYLIHAMDILDKQKIDFKLQIIGDGSLRKDLENQVQVMNLSKRIEFHGFINHKELSKKMFDADIFVGPSINTSLGETEGLGLVFLEAMAAGLAVIGTRVGGIPDVIFDKINGILIEEKDPEAIVSAILLLISDHALRKKIIDNGKKYSENYDWVKIAEKHKRVYSCL